MSNYTFKRIVYQKTGNPFLVLHDGYKAPWLTPEDCTALLANTDKLRLFIAGEKKPAPKPSVSGGGRYDPYAKAATALTESPVLPPEVSSLLSALQAKVKALEAATAQTQAATAIAPVAPVQPIPPTNPEIPVDNGCQPVASSVSEDDATPGNKLANLLASLKQPSA